MAPLRIAAGHTHIHLDKVRVEFISYTTKKTGLLRRFFGGGCKKHCYMLPITAFFGTPTIGIVFCSILQWRDIKLPLYICFRGGNVDIAALLKPTAINTPFCADAIATTEKNAAICEL